MSPAPRPNLPLWWRLLQFVLFFPLLWAIAHSLSELPGEHYAAGDAPHQSFRFATSDGQGGCRAEPLGAKSEPCTLPPAPSANPLCRDWPERELRLCTFADGVYQMDVSGGGWTMTTRYRLENGRVVPLYFKLFTFLHAGAAFVLVFAVYAVADFLFRRRLRRASEA
ncbi:hypothetical protein ACLD9W_05880 [Neisseria sp. WLZKY-1]|uniref:hypothetical protein n=1 Tax=Neisseria sp. WLZKY-1 TaxID=3390377 RepID=UPI00397A34BA